MHTPFGFEPSAMRDGKARLESRRLYQNSQNNQITVIKRLFNPGADMAQALIMLQLKTVWVAPRNGDQAGYDPAKHRILSDY
jgi:hypothetical protein